MAGFFNKLKNAGVVSASVPIFFNTPEGSLLRRSRCVLPVVMVANPGFVIGELESGRQGRGRQEEG
jgi:hypothetical protein